MADPGEPLPSKMPAERLDKPRVEIWLEVEPRCNLQCKFCYNYWRDGSLQEPTATPVQQRIAALERLLSQVECAQIALSGGEPLLYPDLDYLLESLKQHGIPMVLTTNGLLLSESRVEQLMKLGVASFQVSLHSHDETTHDWMVGQESSWRAAIKAIASVQKQGCHITPVFVATRANLQHFAKVVEICRLLSIESIIFNRFIPSGLGAIWQTALGVPSDQELWDALSSVEPLVGKSGLTIQMGVPLPPVASRQPSKLMLEPASCPVHRGQQRWTIGPDLLVRKCNHSANSFGSLADGGIQRLLAEARRAPAPTETLRIRECGFLSEKRHGKRRVINILRA